MWLHHMYQPVIRPIDIDSKEILNVTLNSNVKVHLLEVSYDFVKFIVIRSCK